MPLHSTPFFSIAAYTALNCHEALHQVPSRLNAWAIPGAILIRLWLCAAAAAAAAAAAQVRCWSVDAATAKAEPVGSQRHERPALCSG